VHVKGSGSEFSIDVSLCAPRPAAFGAVSADNIRNLPIELGALCVGEKLLVGVLGGPFQGDVNVPGPNALKVCLAPRRLGDRRRFARRRRE
jgi:hypothetical protein